MREPRYTEYKAIMREKEITQEMIAKEIGRTREYVSKKFTGYGNFKLDELYVMLELAGLEPIDLPIYFPPDGVKVERLPNIPDGMLLVPKQHLDYAKTIVGALG